MRRNGFITALAVACALAAVASAATQKKKPSPSPAKAAPKPAAVDPASEAARAKSLVAEKRYAEGEAAARSAMSVDPTNDVAVAALGQALVAQKKYDDAIQSLSSVIAARKEAAYAYFWRAQGYNGKKQPDRMISDYETFLKLRPDAPEAPTVRQLLAGFR
jgi:tetratricopeptide (TPR) repeat protein